MTCCADCAKLNLNDQNRYGEFWCGERKKYYPGSDSICNDFIARNEKTDCYLTTIIVQCLGYDDYCSYLKILRNFRDSIMKPVPIYQPLLAEYNYIGPSIAYKISEDPNNKVLSKELMENFIKPVCNFIENQNYESAIQLYKSMVIKLKRHYSFDNI